VDVRGLQFNFIDGFSRQCHTDLKVAHCNQSSECNGEVILIHAIKVYRVSGGIA